ncbi:MAG: hypothetical protein OEZ57_08010 [Nitrospirota bacterium]|nr:hypothetical protein [Nitrospirota bacterium]
MEINHLPPPSTIPPLRAPSAVGDGDAGPNSPYYRGRKPKPRDSKKESREAQTPHLEGSTSHIDIRV